MTLNPSITVTHQELICLATALHCVKYSTHGFNWLYKMDASISICMLWKQLCWWICIIKFVRMGIKIAIISLSKYAAHVNWEDYFFNHRNRHIFLIHSRSRACAEHLMRLTILPAVCFLVRQCFTKIERKSCHSHVLSTFIGSAECQDVKQSFALPVSQSTTACSLFSWETDGSDVERCQRPYKLCAQLWQKI